MSTKYSLAHLSDDSLDRGIHASAARKHGTDAELLAFIAEYDSRRRYVALGYDSMHAFCVQGLRLSVDSAYKRIQAARIALEFPALFPALAEARLHLSAVTLLAPHLTDETAEELIAAATHRSKAEIQQLLAERFPREQPSRMSLLPASAGQERHAAESGDDPSAVPALGRVDGSQTELAPGRVDGSSTRLAPGQVEKLDCWARVTPLSGDRYSVSMTIDRATLELLRQNQSLLSHQIPSGNLAEVLRRALAESARQFEKRKFRASGPARGVGGRKPGSRYVPKHVRDAVWRRDGGRCTYVGETGHRCGADKRLEFDHIVPVSRGGEATADNLRLRCRVHNQHEANRVFGAEFMRHKRERAREVASVPHDRVCVRSGASTAASHESTTRDWLGKARARAAAAGIAVTRREPEVEAVLRHLGANADDAGRAARLCETIPEAPLEQRLRVALSFLYARSPGPRVAEGRRVPG